MIKFVCTRLNAMTKKQDGTPRKYLHDLFLKRTGRCDNIDPDYAWAMAGLEAGLADAVKLDDLTCASCGRLCGLFNGRDGFDNEDYKRANYSRECMHCAEFGETPRDFCNVGEQQYVYCWGCGEFVLRGEALSSEGILKVFGSHWLEYIGGVIGTNWTDWHCRACLRAKAIRRIDGMNFLEVERERS